MYQKCAALLGLLIIASAGSSKASANDCDDLIGRHMAGEAMLAAQFVALAEKAGMAPSEINATLKKISENSAIEEFWITDPDGHAYLTNTGLDFTFGPDARCVPRGARARGGDEVGAPLAPSSCACSEGPGKAQTKLAEWPAGFVCLSDRQKSGPSPACLATSCHFNSPEMGSAK
jgi:hypothetical protein